MKTILRDTMMGNGYLMPLKVKLKGNDTVFIYSFQTQFLFQYFNERYGWNGRIFMDTLMPYLLHDKVMEIEDDEYFIKDKRWAIPVSECNCMYNERKKRLMEIIRNKEFNIPTDGQFSCLVYKSFKKRLILDIGEEGEVGVMKFDKYLTYPDQW